jgi:hypothetical protein
VALSRTSRADTGANAATVTTAAFTPNNNSLLVAFLFCVDFADGMDGLSPTVSGGSLTWTERVSIKWSASDGGNNGYYIGIWTAPVSSGSSMQITGGVTGVDEVLLQVVDFTGYDTGSPTGVTASNKDDGSGPGAGLPFSGTLSGAPASNSYVVAASGSDSPSQYTTPGSGFTEIYKNTTSTSDIYDEVEERTGSTSTAVEWASATNFIFGMGGVALEIKAASEAVDLIEPVEATPVIDAEIGLDLSQPYMPDEDYFIQLLAELPYIDVYDEGHSDPGPVEPAAVLDTTAIPDPVQDHGIYAYPYEAGLWEACEFITPEPPPPEPEPTPPPPRHDKRLVVRVQHLKRPPGGLNTFYYVDDE